MDEPTVILSGPDSVVLQAENDPGYIQNLVTEGNWYGSYASASDMDLAREHAQDVESEARKIRQQFEVAYAGYFTARKEVKTENVNFYNSDQWTAADKADLIADGLPPRTSNMMKRQIDTLLGEILAKETEWRATGDTPEADQKAGLIDHLLRATAQQNNWQMLKYYIARDATIGGIGVGSAMLDPADPKGMIKLQRHRQEEFMFHLESAKSGSLAGCKYIWRGYPEDRQRVMWQYPLWAKEISEMDAKMYSYQFPYLDTFIKPKVHRTVGSSVGDDSYTYDLWSSMLSRNVLFKREFYRRRDIPKWRVIDGYTASHSDFDSEDQARVFYGQMRKYYQIVLAPQMSIPENQVNPRISLPRMVEATVVDQEIWIGDSLVSVNTSDIDRVPYKFCIPEFIDGDITSYFEHGKDMQRMRNVAMIFIQKLAASSKGRYIVNDFFKPQNMTQEQFDSMLVSDIAPLHISSSDADAVKKVIGHIAPPQFGTLMNNLIGFATDDLNYQFGGLNAVGLSESANESGRAVMARQQQAAIATIPLMTELENFDREMGEDVAYLWQFTDPNVQVMAVNAEGDPEFKSMASEGIQSISDMKYNIDIVQVLGSATEREAEVSRLGRMIEQGGERIASTIIPLQMKKMDIDYDDRRAIESQLQQQDQFEQQQQERTLAMQEYETKVKWDLAKQDRILKAKALEIEERKLSTPNVSISLRPEASPSILATFLNQYDEEIQATPMQVLMDKAVDQKFKLDVLGAQQVQENKLMTPAQRKIERIKAANMGGPKSGGNKKSAKDTANRQNKSL